MLYIRMVIRVDYAYDFALFELVSLMVVVYAPKGLSLAAVFFRRDVVTGVLRLTHHPN